MIFPITDLLDDQASTAWVEKYFHPKKLRCPGCGATTRYAREFRTHKRGFLDYRCPVASDLPMIEAIMVEVPNPVHPYGVKGVGEVNIVPPMAAIANAIENATGQRMTELPISPPKLAMAIEAGQPKLAAD